MAREVGNGNPINYLKINREGFLYLSSKEPKEGWKKVETEDGKVFYHKLFHGTDEGHLDFIAVKEVEFSSGKVKYLTLSVNTGEYIDNISVPLFKQNGSLNDYVKNLATLLPNLDFSKKVKAKIDSRNEVNTNITVLDQQIGEQKKKNELELLKTEQAIIRSRGLTEAILQEKAINRWNGVLPSTVAGNGLPFVKNIK